MKIVLSVVLAMFLVACSDNKTTKEAPQESVKSETTKVEEPKAPEAAVQEVKEEVQEVTKEVAQKSTEVVAESKKVVEESKQAVEKKVEAVKEEVSKVAEAPKPVEVPKPVAVKTIDGGQLFTKCVACHGANAEKSALGKSKIIKGWSVDKVMTTFHGYKDGTYGGAMKGVMKSQIANYSEEELKALAEHISKL